MEILVVDDDVAIREMFEEVLTDEGYDVVTAANGQQALNKLRERAQHIRLVLLDLMMPIMNGWDVLDARASDTELCAIPVLVMSAAENRTSVAAYVHPDCFLRKPIDITTLLDKIVRYQR